MSKTDGMASKTDGFGSKTGSRILSSSRPDSNAFSGGKRFNDNKSVATTKTKKSAGAKSTRRHRAREPREEDDAKSHATRKSGKSRAAKRQVSGKTDKDGDKSEHKSRASPSVMAKSRRKSGTISRGASRMRDFNETIEKGGNGESFIDSSFDASLSDDEESEEEDDFVTLNEFDEYKKHNDK